MLGIIIALAGCRQVVVENVSQEQARECVQELNTQGVPAIFEKSGTGSHPSYQVMVDSSDTNRANEVLIVRHLPRKEQPTADDLLETHNPFPATPELDALRADRILGREAEQVISLMPELQRVVVVVRLHTVVSAAGARVTGSPPANVLVLGMVKGVVKEEAALATRIKQVVQKVVPQVLPEEGIEVLLQGSPPLSLDAPQATYAKEQMLLIYLAGVLTGGVGLGCIVTMVRRLKDKQDAPAALPTASRLSWLVSRERP